jgi:hypothetical protein
VPETGELASLHDERDVFGTYTVDEAKKTVTYIRIVPESGGEAQTRTIDKLTTEVFVNTDLSVAGGRRSAGTDGRSRSAQRRAASVMVAIVIEYHQLKEICCSFDGG